MKTSAIALLSAIVLASSVAAAPANGVPGYRVEKCKDPGTIAWTFDDGPGPYNDKLLAFLKERNIKVTFFMLGSMIDGNPSQAASLKKVLDAGHMLASHTYTHEKSLSAMSLAELTSEITKTSDAMFKHAGVKPAYVRAPRGECDQVCIDRLTSMGLVVSHWNVDTNDWRQMEMAKKNPQQAATVSMEEPTKFIGASNPATDSFILLEHEIHQFSVELLAPLVADLITKKGYKFVTMEECVGVPAYLAGSTVPTNNPTTPTTVAPPVGATTAPGGVTPTTPPTNPQVTVQPPKPSTSTTSGNSTAGAGMVKAGAWAMGLAAAVAYAFL